MKRITNVVISDFDPRQKHVFASADILKSACSGNMFCDKASVCEHVYSRECPYLRVFDRLAEYEDTGVTPEEIIALLNKQSENRPLTLDELREMDGQPVWIVNVADINCFQGHWDICDWENGERVLFPYCLETPDIADYDPEGKLGVAGWRAYRRQGGGDAK